MLEPAHMHRQTLLESMKEFFSDDERVRFYNAVGFKNFDMYVHDSDEKVVSRVSIVERDGELLLAGYIFAEVNRYTMIVENVALVAFPNSKGNVLIETCRDFVRFVDELGNLGFVSGQFFAVVGGPGLSNYRKLTKMKPDIIREVGVVPAGFRSFDGKYYDIVNFSMLWKDNMAKNKYLGTI